ncbi:hypothetical protein [Neorhizobium sp. DT-125]|uniref:hypothetical protein n=1 Tax=Neorhizobium sp. DT-125 TaxID=3396163 RepID=UPI003F1B6C9F
MPGRNNSGEASGEAGQRGLLKLMLRLPTVRGRLQILAARSSSLAELCEAYEEACAMLDKLEADQSNSDTALIGEYRTICIDIEADVIQYCLDHRHHVPD